MNLRYMIKISSNNLSILLYLFIVTIPFSKTPFIVSCLVLIVCLVVARRKTLTLTLSESSHDYLLSLLLALILIWNQCYISSFNSEHDWKSRLHKTIYPLTGVNVEIVPSFEEGYLLDSTCDGKLENGSVHFETYFQTLKVKKGDSLNATVYCYVSKDFDGDSVRLLVKGAVYGNRVSDYKLFDSYNEKLSVAGNLIINGDFKLGTTNWSPNADSTTHTIIETPFGNGIRVSRTNGNGEDWSMQYVGRPIIYHPGHRYQIRFIFKVEKGNGMPFNIGWWVDEGRGFTAYNLPLGIRKIRNGWNEATYSHIFNQTHYNLVTFLNSLQDYSVVDITNVEMKDLDRNDSIPLFVDQLNKKGTWQKLTINVPCNNGGASVCFSIIKKNVVDFRSLKGYVIFALPKWNK
jgi:hypothetical protein